MPRVHRVTKSRKDWGRCGKPGCSVEIERGDPYLWWKPFRSYKRVRCLAHRPRRSDLTTSEKLATLYAANEAVEDVIAGSPTCVSIAEALRQAAEEARQAGEMYQESAEAILEHFAESPMADELEEKAQECESWADVLEDAAGNADATEDLDEAIGHAEEALGEIPY